jgi:hypothetical protein
MDVVEVHPDGSLRVEALAAHRHPHANRFTTKVATIRLSARQLSELLPVTVQAVLLCCSAHRVLLPALRSRNTSCQIHLMM